VWRQTYGYLPGHRAQPLDSQLSPSAHVVGLCRSCYYQLRQLRPEIRSLTSDAAKTLVQAFITCRLDYCNPLLCGISNYLMQQVQFLQNAAERLITGTRRCEHITPVLQKLLPVHHSKGGVQAHVPSPPVVGWTNTVVSSFRPSIYYQHWPSSASIRVWEDMCRSTHTQQFRRQKFFCCRSSCVERLAIISASGNELQPLQACTERTYV